MKKIIMLIILFLLIPMLAFSTPYEYSDAPESYKTASHVTGEWQRLGNKWDSENSPLRVNNDKSDDGVSWSTKGGAFGNEKVKSGEKVTFRFDVNRASYGDHKYDQLKVWIDLNGDDYFSINELIDAEQWYKNEDAGIYQKYFYANVYFSDQSYDVDYWIRARVSCDHTSFDNTTPYDSLWQGEVEDWKIRVESIPEPNTLILLCLGIFGIIYQKNKNT